MTPEEIEKFNSQSNLEESVITEEFLRDLQLVLHRHSEISVLGVYLWILEPVDDGYSLGVETIFAPSMSIEQIQEMTSHAADLSHLVASKASSLDEKSVFKAAE